MPLHEEAAIKIGQFSQGQTVRMMLIDDGIDTAHHIAEVLVKASMVVTWVELISTHGNFLYFQDTTSVHLAQTVVFLHNVSRCPVLQALGDIQTQLTAVLPSFHAHAAVARC